MLKCAFSLSAVHKKSNVIRQGEPGFYYFLSSRSRGSRSRVTITCVPDLQLLLLDAPGNKQPFLEEAANWPTQRKDLERHAGTCVFRGLVHRKFQTHRENIWNAVRLPWVLSAMYGSLHDNFAQTRSADLGAEFVDAK